MADKKKPVDEDAHFRIDEMERRMASVPSADHVAGIASGALSVMLEEINRKIDGLQIATDEDVKADRELIATIRELIEQLKKPKTATLSDGRKIVLE